MSMEDDNFRPDLGAMYLKTGRAESTFTFTRLAFSLIARIDDGMYTLMSTLDMAESYALSIDFEDAEFDGLLAVLPSDARHQLQRIFSTPFAEPHSVELPQGSVTAGVKARLGEPQVNDDETYVPFVAFEFMPPSESASIMVDDSKSGRR